MQTLKLIYHFISSIKALVWGLIYLICIPLFASIYNSMPHEFYHSTFQMEQNSTILNSQIAYELESEIKKEYREYFTFKKNLADKYDYFHVENVSYLKDDEDIYNLSKKIRFTFSIPYLIEGYKTYTQRRRVEFASECYTEDLINNSRFYRVYPVDYKFQSGDLQIDYLFAIHEDSVHVYNFVNWEVTSLDNGLQHGYIHLSKDLVSKITSYINASQGLPSEVNGNYGRMLYFSAVTITTLGYGDIVPLTNKARMWVGIQAVLGIVIIGLFLNSLFSKRNS